MYIHCQHKDTFAILLVFIKAFIDYPFHISRPSLDLRTTDEILQCSTISHGYDGLLIERREQLKENANKYFVSAWFTLLMDYELLTPGNRWLFRYIHSFNTEQTPKKTSVVVEVNMMASFLWHPHSRHFRLFFLFCCWNLESFLRRKDQSIHHFDLSPPKPLNQRVLNILLRPPHIVVESFLSCIHQQKKGLCISLCWWKPNRLTPVLHRIQYNIVYVNIPMSEN